LPTGVARPDVAAYLAVGVGADRSGFGGAVGLVGAPFPRAELVLRAHLGDLRVPFARIEIQRERLGSVRGGIQPLAIIMVGRSGSMWLLQLLATHPDIVAYQPFRLEPRLTRYWLDILRALGAPGSFAYALGPRSRRENWWLGDPDVGWVPDVPDPALADWLSAEAVEALADFCLSRIDAFYSFVRDLSGKPQARYFAEKQDPTSLFNASLLREHYDHPLEFVLVRDPRDQLASMRAFNAAGRGRPFGPGTDDIEVLAEWFASRMSDLTSRWLACREDGVALLRYEDLVREPFESLQLLLSKLGLESGDEVVGTMLREARERNPELQAAHATAESPERSIGRWQRDFDASERRLLDEWLGETLDVFGYPRAAD